jgi:hypothetical protein
LFHPAPVLLPSRSRQLGRRDFASIHNVVGIGCGVYSKTSRAYGELEHRPIEGFIHKLKLLKCQDYGRATFDLLRARALAF